MKLQNKILCIVSLALFETSMAKGVFYDYLISRNALGLIVDDKEKLYKFCSDTKSGENGQEIATKPSDGNSGSNLYNSIMVQDLLFIEAQKGTDIKLTGGESLGRLNSLCILNLIKKVLNSNDEDIDNLTNDDFIDNFVEEIIKSISDDIDESKVASLKNDVKFYWKSPFWNAHYVAKALRNKINSIRLNKNKEKIPNYAEDNKSFRELVEIKKSFKLESIDINFKKGEGFLKMLNVLCENLYRKTMIETEVCNINKSVNDFLLIIEKYQEDDNIAEMKKRFVQWEKFVKQKEKLEKQVTEFGNLYGNISGKLLKLIGKRNISDKLFELISRRNISDKLFELIGRRNICDKLFELIGKQGIESLGNDRNSLWNNINLLFPFIAGFHNAIIEKAENYTYDKFTFSSNLIKLFYELTIKEKAEYLLSLLSIERSEELVEKLCKGIKLEEIIKLINIVDSQPELVKKYFPQGTTKVVGSKVAGKLTKGKVAGSKVAGIVTEGKVAGSKVADSVTKGKVVGSKVAGSVTKGKVADDTMSKALESLIGEGEWEKFVKEIEKLFPPKKQEFSFLECIISNAINYSIGEAEKGENGGETKKSESSIKAKTKGPAYNLSYNNEEKFSLGRGAIKSLFNISGNEIQVNSRLNGYFPSTANSSNNSANKGDASDKSLFNISGSEIKVNSRLNGYFPSTANSSNNNANKGNDLEEEKISRIKRELCNIVLGVIKDDKKFNYLENNEDFRNFLAWLLKVIGINNVSSKKTPVEILKFFESYFNKLLGKQQSKGEADTQSNAEIK